MTDAIPAAMPPSPTGRASIRDVAARAGVSVTTVSHTLNGTRFVSDAAKAKVHEAAHALGYVPSEVARGLKHNTTRTLGMLVPNNSNPYFAEIIRGVEHHCYGAGYSLLLCNSNDDPQQQADHLRVLAERRVDGIVLVASGDDDAIVAACKDLRLPLVLVDREIDAIAVDLIEVDHAAGGELATAHLLGAGPRARGLHRRPGRPAAQPAARGRLAARARARGRHAARRRDRARRLQPARRRRGDAPPAAVGAAADAPCSSATT